MASKSIIEIIKFLLSSPASCSRIFIPLHDSMTEESSDAAGRGISIVSKHAFTQSHRIISSFHRDPGSCVTRDNRQKIVLSTARSPSFIDSTHSTHRGNTAHHTPTRMHPPELFGESKENTKLAVEYYYCRKSDENNRISSCSPVVFQ
jgi:hypothetical protein